MTSEVEYLGQLRTSSVHIKSGEKILTDAPTDNNGKGEAFSPTDMVANSAATCMLTIMAISAEKRGVSIDGAKATVEKIMASEPRRISQINIKVQMPAGDYTDVQKMLLKKAGHNCPVLLSLHPDIKQNIEISW